MANLTKREKQVLVELLKNCKLTDQEISRKLKTSRPTVFKIRKRIEEKGLIERYAAIPDIEKFGLRVHALILFKWKDYSKTSELKEVISFIKSLPETVFFARTENNKTDVILSLHEGLKEFEEYIKKIKYKLEDNVSDIDVILFSADNIVKSYDVSSLVIDRVKER